MSRGRDSVDRIGFSTSFDVLSALAFLLCLVSVPRAQGAVAERAPNETPSMPHLFDDTHSFYNGKRRHRQDSFNPGIN